MDHVLTLAYAGLAGIFGSLDWAQMLLAHEARMRRREMLSRGPSGDRSPPAAELAVMQDIFSGQVAEYLNAPRPAARMSFTMDEVGEIVAFARGRCRNPHLAAICAYACGCIMAAECEPGLSDIADPGRAAWLGGDGEDGAAARETLRYYTRIMAPRPTGAWQAAIAALPHHCIPSLRLAQRVQKHLLPS